MKVLLVSNYYPPHHLGGQELEAAEIAAELRARGHGVEVLTSRHGSGRVTENGVHRVLWPEMELRRAWPALHFFTHRRSRLRRSIDETVGLLTRFRPDVALVMGAWNLPWEILATIEQELDDRVLYRFADYWPTLPSQHVLYWRAQGRGPARWIKPTIARLALRGLTDRPVLRLKHVACVSAAVRAALREQGVAIPDAGVLHTGIDASPFLEAGESRTVQPQLRLVQVGRVAKEKGIDVAIRALARLADGVGARLTVVGGGAATDLRDLRQLSRDLGVGQQVDFVGAVGRSEIPRILGEHDVFVLPARWDEPLARAPMEAMAAAMPVVATARGGLPELVEDGRTGILVPSDDPQALATAIDRLAASPSLRRQMGEAARSRVLERFALPDSIDRLVETLDRVRECAGSAVAQVPRS